ncbi:hypothetical protein [Roseisolibacter sp. H3M3-2]|uniref:hypothetical protein n=1 Tax=Roseisolibacter sp. H3M3-2 TaxID=3031323 RepID=UPI0023D9F22A|nr:hypothetical protein [Roseisolibacter sp. H3M3-2]MDF1502408.1 hypothetical protein [Roseisolibacter sp. H3M3-2]
MRVRIGRRTAALDPSAAIGKGGEADVYAVGAELAVKVFKAPDHPDLAGQPALQQAARVRLAEQQEKLRALCALPAGLPARVVAPAELALDARTGLVVGYAMPRVRDAEVLYRFGEPAARAEGAGSLPGEATAVGLVGLFAGLAATVEQLHARGVVVGDFNDLNVLVTRGARPGALEPHLIDIDSAQFGAYRCRAYTERFLDPLLCDPAGPRPAPVRAYAPTADWYAFAAMLFRTLALVDPYGGVLVPARPEDRVPHPARPLRRLSVLHAAVRRPKAARPLETLGDDALEAFRRVFADDWRGPFPLATLAPERWRRCGACGLEHARSRCPRCAGVPAAAQPAAVVVRGSVTARTLVRAQGVGARVVAVAVGADGRPAWVVEERGEWRREDGRVVARPAALARAGGRLRALIAGGATVVVGRDGMAAGAEDAPVVGVDPAGAGGDGAAAVGGGRLAWIDGGLLYRQGPVGPQVIGSVLRGQTRLWLGPTFGVGVSRADRVAVTFVFDAARGGIRDGVRVPRVSGQVVRERCAVAADRAWLVTEVVEAGRQLARLAVVRRDGTVEASAEAESGDGGWLAGVRAMAAAGPWLFVLTDDGLQRVAVQGGAVAVDARYPDADPLLGDDVVDLLVGGGGLVVVGEREVRTLAI